MGQMTQQTVSKH